jgi:glutamine amidotransferase
MSAAELAIVDYGMGNIGSVVNAFRRLGSNCVVTADPTELRRARSIVLPGVGAFKSAMDNLRDRGLVEALAERVVGERIPFLGICLGLQLLAKDSTEQGFSNGLGWIDAHVERIVPRPAKPVPHVGWNEVELMTRSPLFERLPAGAHFYFDHSYHLRCTESCVTAICGYGGSWVAAVAKDNIHAVQFHPEKSQRTGLRLLRNFLNYAARH